MMIRIIDSNFISHCEIKSQLFHINDILSRKKYHDGPHCSILFNL